MGRLSQFFKKHLVGVFIVGVLASLTSAYIFDFIPKTLTNSQKTIEGVIVLNNFEVYEVKYGLEFKTPPQLQFYQMLNGRNGGIFQGESIKLLEQLNDGFKYEVVNGITSGENIRWVAKGYSK